MGRRASPTLIGLFVTGGLALVVGALVLLGGRQWFTRNVTCVMAFDGSVAGLAVGAPVSFRGVRVGNVSDIQFRYPSGLIVVFAHLDPTKVHGGPREIPEARRTVEENIQHGLRAQLQLESLITGQLYVGLDHYPDTPVTLTGVEKDTCEIPTIPTTLARLQSQLMKIVQQVAEVDLKQLVGAAVRTLDGIERVVTSPELQHTLRAADGTLREAELLVRDVRARVGPAAASLERTLEQARRTIDEAGGDVRRLVANVDARIGPLADSIGATTDSAGALIEDARGTVRRLDEQIGPTLEQARRTIDEAGGDVRRLIANVDARIGPLATSIGATSDSARAAIEDAARTVGRLEKQLGAAMLAVRQAAEATSETMRRAETTLGQVDGALDGSSPLGYRLAEALEQLGRAAASLRVLSEEINRHPNVLLFGRGGTKR